LPIQSVVFSRDQLRALRERAGYSRTQLAYHLDRTEQTVYLWEVGRTQPLPGVLGRLASVLGCAIDDLFAPVRADDPVATNAGPSKSRRSGTRHDQQ
jgi:DNA-binding XRE family transcriptional regulator